jgi:hypothetical protein
MLGLQDDINDVELKQRWRLYWIHCIFEFSSTTLQEMAWVQGSEADWPNGEDLSSSFEECNASYFDNLDLYGGYAKAIDQGNVSKEEADSANAFHMLAASYIEPDDDPELILNDAEWLEVVDSAKTFWDYLKTNVTAQREIDLIKKLEKEFA